MTLDSQGCQPLVASQKARRESRSDGIRGENAIAPRFLAMRSRLSDQGLAPLAIACHRYAIQDKNGTKPKAKNVRISGNRCVSFAERTTTLFSGHATLEILQMHCADRLFSCRILSPHGVQKSQYSLCTHRSNSSRLKDLCSDLVISCVPRLLF